MDKYEIKATTQYEDKDVNIIEINLLVEANSIEEACKKARDFIKPIAILVPIKCEWQD